MAQQETESLALQRCLAENNSLQDSLLHTNLHSLLKVNLLEMLWYPAVF